MQDELSADELGVGGRDGLVYAFTGHPRNFHCLAACLYVPLEPPALAAGRACRRHRSAPCLPSIRPCADWDGHRLVITGCRSPHETQGFDLEISMAEHGETEHCPAEH